MTSMSVTRARAALPELLDRVERGEEVTITRHGRPVAMLVGALRPRRASAASAFEEAERIRRMIANPAPVGGAGLSIDRAEHLVRELRAERDAD